MLHLMVGEPEVEYTAIAARTRGIEMAPDDTISDVHSKASQFQGLIVSPEYRHRQQVANAWCAAFVWKKLTNMSVEPITTDIIRRLEADAGALSPAQDREVERLSRQYQFFHWHLAFPEVYSRGGFDCVLGNPPWDKIQPEEEKFFSSFRPDIANAPSAKLRKTLIENLPRDDPRSHLAWSEYKRQIDSTCHFLRSSGVLRFSGDGNLNSYRVFTELATNLAGSRGRAGLVAQTGLATDESGKEMFDYLLNTGRLCRFLDFENRGEFFVDVHQQFRFCLVTIRGQGLSGSSHAAEFGWLLHDLAELTVPNRLVQLTAKDLLLFNPSSRTCPVFTSVQDVDLGRRIYQAGEHVMIDASHRFARIDFLGEMFNMTRDSASFAKEPLEDGLPLYEAKFIHQFDHRFATAAGGEVRDITPLEKANPTAVVTPKSWVAKELVVSRASKRQMHDRWMFGFRDIASPTNERTAIAAVVPFSAVGNNINLILGLSALETAIFEANINAFVFDFCTRQKVSGSHVNIWIFKQLPAIPLQRYSESCSWSSNALPLQSWLLSRTLELTYTAWNLKSFAEDCGWSEPPFHWDEDRRFLLRCELDAAFFHLYLAAEADGSWSTVGAGTLGDLNHLKAGFPTPRNAVSYIMDTFPIVRRKDEEEFNGDYRTKRVILEIYDLMQDAMRTGQPYQTRLDPPPADSRVAHPSKEASV